MQIVYFGAKLLIFAILGYFSQPVGGLVSTKYGNAAASNKHG